MAKESPVKAAPTTRVTRRITRQTTPPPPALRVTKLGQGSGSARGKKQYGAVRGPPPEPAEVRRARIIRLQPHHCWAGHGPIRTRCFTGQPWHFKWCPNHDNDPPGLQDHLVQPRRGCARCEQKARDVEVAVQAERARVAAIERATSQEALDRAKAKAKEALAAHRKANRRGGK